MNGANEFCKVFNKPEQIERLFLVPGSHARGPTFNIWILPTNELLEKGVMPWTVKDSIKVYGAVSGQLGWTESYGWKHKGKWVDDFEKALKHRKEIIESNNLESLRIKGLKEQELKDNINTLLNGYK